jgi:hypothetical protein
MNWSSIICHFSFVMTDAASDVVRRDELLCRRRENDKWKMANDN